jgi:hypothetical protein
MPLFAIHSTIVVGIRVMRFTNFAVALKAVHLDWSELIVSTDAKRAQFAVVQQPHGRSYTA